MKHIPRFYFEPMIKEGRGLKLSVEQLHHVSKVLRIPTGGCVHVFNDIDGEWLCELGKNGIVVPEKLIRSPLTEPGPNVACALINPHKFSIMLEKITELGVKEITPIITEYTQYQDFNFDKMKKIVIQACEQSRRLSIPVINKVMHLNDFLENFPRSSTLMVGNENERSKTLKESLEEQCTFLVGPEGGFSEAETKLFSRYDFVKQFYFGQNILRSETAAIAFVSSWMFWYA